MPAQLGELLHGEKILPPERHVEILGKAERKTRHQQEELFRDAD